MELKDKVFLLGVGAQKSGTTWLHAYLKNHPEVDMGFTKEYHIFDALYISDFGIRKKFIQARFEKALHSSHLLKDNDRKIISFLADTQRYFEYFHELLGNENIKLSGDITPSYSGLPVDALIEIKNNFQRHGIKVKVLLLMREPVSRCISAVQHILRQKGISYTGYSHFGKDKVFLLRELFASPAFTMRGRYDKTAGNLEKVFEEKDIGYFLYEELFQSQTISELCHFLDISWHEPNYYERINASNNRLIIDNELKQLIKTEYQPVYEFVKEKFGNERMLAAWNN